MAMLGLGLTSAGCASGMQGSTGNAVGSARLTVASEHPESNVRFFSPTSFWNLPTSADAPLDPHSTEIVDALNATVTAESREGEGPWLNTTNYSVPVYTVPSNQPTVRVHLVNSRAPALQSAWRRVPLPPHAQPAAGSDGTLVVWQPARDRLWEFWRLEHVGVRWQASWGGAMRHVSSQPGVYGPKASPGAKPWWGSSASSLSIVGGLVTFQDLERGVIDHALAIAVPEPRAGFFASPARRTDGTSTSPTSIPEGAHLRLDPKLNLNSLNLPPMTLMIARAVQRYGIFVRDHARVVHFFAQDPVAGGPNPYSGSNGYFEGRSPAQLLDAFPWRRLQLLKMRLHRAGPSHERRNP